MRSWKVGQAAGGGGGGGGGAVGLSTSCSATFRQLSIFLATFLLSSNFLSEEQLDAFFLQLSNISVRNCLHLPKY